jgi:MFS family permease
MDLYRKTATIVGVLFIIATVAPIISGVFLGPLSDISGGDDSDYLTETSENEKQVIIGAIFYIIMAVAVASIAIVIYPILKKHNEALALGYVGARIAEGLLFIVNIIAILTLLTLSQEFVKAGGSPDVSYFQTLGDLLLAAGDWAYMLGFGLAFTISALILNYVLYRSKLVPRWLSVWGFIGAVLIFIYYLLQPFSINLVEILFLPIAVQEMVFAVWLIVKGFSPQEIKSKSG